MIQLKVFNRSRKMLVILIALVTLAIVLLFAARFVLYPVGISLDEYYRSIGCSCNYSWFLLTSILGKFLYSVFNGEKDLQKIDVR